MGAYPAPWHSATTAANWRLPRRMDPSPCAREAPVASNQWPGERVPRFWPWHTRHLEIFWPVGAPMAGH